MARVFLIAAVVWLIPAFIFGQASRPSLGELETKASKADADLRAAQAALDKAKAEHDVRADTSPGMKEAKSEVAGREKELNVARAGDDIQARLTASSAFVSAREKVAKLTKAFNSFPDEKLAAAQKTVSFVKGVADRAKIEFGLEKDRIDRLAKRAAANAALPVLTIKQLENLGERYEGKEVRMTVSFDEPSTGDVDLLPGVTLRSNGLVSVIDRSEMEKWIGLGVRDKETKEWFPRCFASKATYGDILVKMKPGTPITLTGYVVQTNHAGWYALVCHRIETTD